MYVVHPVLEGCDRGDEEATATPTTCQVVLQSGVRYLIGTEYMYLISMYHSFC